MRRLLLATAAASALALAPFWAAAQDTYGTTPQTQTSPEMNAPPAMPPPAAPAPEATPPPTTEPDTTAPDATAPDTQAQTPPADTYSAAPAEATTAMNTQPTPEQVALVQDMGLSGVPMSAADVCAQRTVSLDRSNGMTRDQKVRFAVDYASTCKVQQVVIRAPRGQQARLQRIVEDHGVTADMISTETAPSSDASMQLSFAGLATSSAQYAAMFNPQYAANTSYTPSASDSGYTTPTSPTGTGTTPESGAPQTTTPPPTTDYNNQTTTDTSPSETTTAPPNTDTTPPPTPSPDTY